MPFMTLLSKIDSLYKEVGIINLNTTLCKTGSRIFEFLSKGESDTFVSFFGLRKSRSLKGQ